MLLAIDPSMTRNGVAFKSVPKLQHYQSRKRQKFESTDDDQIVILEASSPFVPLSTPSPLPNAWPLPLGYDRKNQSVKPGGHGREHASSTESSPCPETFRATNILIFSPLQTRLDPSKGWNFVGASPLRNRNGQKNFPYTFVA